MPGDGSLFSAFAQAVSLERVTWRKPNNGGDPTAAVVHTVGRMLFDADLSNVRVNDPWKRYDLSTLNRLHRRRG